MKVSDDPEQVGLLPDVKAIATEGVTVVLTVTVMELEFAAAGLAQAALDVMVQLTT